MEGDEARKKLRREIKMWWQGVTDHMDKIENHIASEHNVLSRKSLPRLPSTIDPYEDDMLDESTIPEESLQSLPPLPPSPPTSPKLNPVPDPPEDRFSTRTSLMRLVAGYYATQPPNTRTNTSSQSQPPDASTLLSNLRYSFQRSEQALYAQLSRTPTTNLNDVRREFAGVARGAERRLYAWQNKHARAAGEADLGKLVTEEPEWWKNGCHAIPGGKVVVREGEWGSIISFTLSSADYQRELANMSATRQGSTSTTSSPLSNTSTKKSTGSNSTATSNGYSVLSKHFSNAPTPDPDQDSPIWQESEQHSAAISRHEHPRDQSGLLSLRDVLRHRRSSADNGSSALLNSRFGSMGLAAASKFARVGTPPSAWAKPAVEVSMQAAGGLVSGLPDTSESAEKILMEMEPFADGSASLSSSTSSSGFIETHIRSGKAGSIISIESDSTLGPDTFPSPSKQQETPSKSMRSRSPARGIPTNPATGSNPASRDPSPNTRSNTMSSHASSTVQTTSSEKESESGSSTAPSVEVSPDPAHSHEQTETTVSSVATTLTSTFTQAAQVVRSMLNPEPLPRAPSPAHHHALLTMDSSSIDERPHIKYDWTIGKRLKFSCTVYYAKQFDALRKKCGVDDDFIKSLERSENWAAEGGKSKSNFWKTSDDRFIIKTLVNAWNVADLQVLIEMGPSYFKYLDSTANRPSVLAKLLGFYTVEIKNLETGNVQAKADLLVMENLFYDQKISKTFDLKGIQGRKVKASGSSAPSKKILFDGEWIEGQQKVLTLVYPYSKVVLREAVKADADFLSKSNIMDYSLLLGIDEERRQIACGLVDTIGSYTFAKTLEYKAKQNLNSGKEVTVIPPNEYHDRFITAMNSYFLSCPDKWSRSSLDTVSDGESLLPSVL
ncbi:SAICAR synthase-like protein [Rickenella mellea]|uniref:SAICAR synthase-like protein n=1 Tax=Rickenella mellea TaxID=50990 RepID=A0A4Y7PNR8_9AGAM|nr:SAICAR synthase-like protein [Rickenella mellea]